MTGDGGNPDRPRSSAESAFLWSELPETTSTGMPSLRRRLWPIGYSTTRSDSLVTTPGSADEPAKAGCSIADIAAGMYAYSNILAALLQRAEAIEGKKELGRFVLAHHAVVHEDDHAREVRLRKDLGPSAGLGIAAYIHLSLFLCS